MWMWFIVKCCMLYGDLTVVAIQLLGKVREGLVGSSGHDAENDIHRARAHPVDESAGFTERVCLVR